MFMEFIIQNKRAEKRIKFPCDEDQYQLICKDLKLTDKSEYRGLPSAFDPRIYETAVFYSYASILIQCGANQPEGIYGRVADRAERIRTHTLSRTRNVFVPLREREILA